MKEEKLIAKSELKLKGITDTSGYGADIKIKKTRVSNELSRSKRKLELMKK